MKDSDIWTFISMLGLLAFNWPFLEIFRERPVAYLFFAWAALIGIAVLISSANDGDERRKGA